MPDSPPSAPDSPLLSVVIPVFNELATIELVLAAVRSVDIEKEVIVVDDGSTDGTREWLQDLAADDTGIRLLLQETNHGKGAAVRAGVAVARGHFVIIQDGDLEYDPAEYPKLLAPLVGGKADVVYGSRFIGGDSHRVLYFWHSLGNSVLTTLSNMLTNLNLSDMECCYKAFRRDVIQSLALEEDGFGFEPEVTAKVAAYRQDGRPLRIYEVGISYHGRTYEEGKKIGWRDGFHALGCIFRYNLWR